MYYKDFFDLCCISFNKANKEILLQNYIESCSVGGLQKVWLNVCLYMVLGASIAKENQGKVTMWRGYYGGEAE